jgi:hypothetical protein
MSDERASLIAQPPRSLKLGGDPEFVLCLKVSVLSHFTRHLHSMHLIQACHSQKRPNLLTQAQHDYPQVTAFSRPLQFVISATPQADKPATPSGYTRGLFESGVSVSRLVSWHFRGLERQCHSCFGMEGIYTLARPNQRTFIVHIRTAIR